VFLSENYGQTWRPIGAGLPQASVHRIREHPSNPNLLAVGTEMGVYASFDRGGRWTTLGMNLPPVPVYDLMFQERSGALVAGTHGRSIWVLDHIEALAQITPEVLSGDARLFPPPPAHHTSIFGGQFWFGAGEFFAPNPPPGAVLSYYLPQENPGGVQIAIRDGAGNVVRTLRGPTQAGLNRACWDLRREPAMAENALPAPATCPAVARGGAGPLVPPGKYTAVVTPAGAPPMHAELPIQPDPRSKITEADRRSRETSLMAAYSLQQQLIPARQAAQLAGGQLAAMRGAVSGDAVALLERALRDLGRALGQLNGAIGSAARSQNAIDGYEGPPTAAQLRELDWAWEDAVAGIAGLNQVIRDDMPALYTAAGASPRWTPLKPVTALKR
jgi:hypothetical protein